MRGDMLSTVPEGRPGTPCQHWHNTWGGLTSCLSLCPHFHFAAPLTPLSIHRSRGQQGHFSSFLSCVLAVFLPPSVCAHSGSCNHTHFQILSISTNVAHLSKGWKEHRERRRCTGKEGMKRENKEQKEKKWLGRCFSSLFFKHPSFSFFYPFPKDAIFSAPV